MRKKSPEARLLEIVGALSDVPFQYDDQDQALKRITELGKEAMNSHTCTLAFVDLDRKILKHVACASSNKEMEEFLIEHTELPIEGYLDFNVIGTGDVLQLYNLHEDGQGVANPEIAKKYGFNSLLGHPLLSNSSLIGYINHFSSQQKFTPDQERLIEIFAHQAMLTMEWFNQRKLEKLVGIMLEMWEETEADDLLAHFLKGGRELVGAVEGGISRLNYSTGDLDIVPLGREAVMQRKLPYGRGITGKALKDERPIRAGNVHDPEWIGIYERFWPDTISEMAIPILLNRAKIREGKEVKDGLKKIGVLNMESRWPNAFSQTDEDCVLSLVRYAALMIDRLEFDKKSGDLRDVEDRIANETDHEKILMYISTGIRRILGFDYVNIYLVIPEQNCIRSEYVDGIEKHEIEKFKQKATYPLSSSFIYADIVRSGEIEALDVGDKRLDLELARRFHSDDLLRVLNPMIEPSTRKVIGVVEAGYKKTQYRNHIYERDVQMLKSFVDHAAQALQLEKTYLLDQIIHELRAPIGGLRSNASFLERRFRELSEQLVSNKLADMLVDSTILSYQVEELEYFLGKPRRVSKLEETLVYRDVIIKTIDQLKPMIAVRSLDLSRLIYNPADSEGMRVFTDPVRLSQVVFNLLTNSIKYAEDNPDDFKVRIEVKEDHDNFIIRFQDWGIGIDEPYVSRVFERGFRTPQAKRKDVNSSGLGLTISKAIMKELRGDLKLTNNHNPTEFQVILPKKREGEIQ